MGVELQSLAWDADLGLIGAFDHLYQIDTVIGSASIGSASQIGTTDFTAEISGMFNGLYALAAVVTETAPDGDFDMDGDVDGADFLTWQRDQSVGALSDWTANYGPGPLAASVAVPEPSTWMLLSLTVAGGNLARRRRIAGESQELMDASVDEADAVS